MKSINNENLILASKSPRRKQLLEQVGITIQVFPSDIDEKLVLIKDPVDLVKELSFLKARKTASNFPETWILAADTIVVIQDEILGKPESEAHAIEMLNKLNNCEHSVYTGFCLMHPESNIMVKKSVETKVRFKSLTDSEIRWYVDSGEPFDKAGSYAIQGIGAFLVKQISGSYSNVVGLPVCEVVETLIGLNIIQF